MGNPFSRSEGEGQFRSCEGGEHGCAFGKLVERIKPSVLRELQPTTFEHFLDHVVFIVSLIDEAEVIEPRFDDPFPDYDNESVLAESWQPQQGQGVILTARSGSVMGSTMGQLALIG